MIPTQLVGLIDGGLELVGADEGGEIDQRPAGSRHGYAIASSAVPIGHQAASMDAYAR
jgi:hypothetical protein